MSRDASNDTKRDVARVQEQLLDMLRMTGTEAPPPRREPAAAVAVLAPPVVAPVQAAASAAAPAAASNAPPLPGEDCPKCGSDTPWGRSNWCPECGYYPKAGFGGTGIVEDDTGPPPSLLSVIPAWVIPTLVASLAMFIGSVICRFVFNDALLRSLVAITQLLVFAAFTFGVHSRASLLAMKTGRGWMAFVNPGETWALVLGRMPATRTLIMLLGCGLSGMASAFVIGPDVDLVAKEIAKEVKNRPKVTFSDIMKAMTKMSGKAFGDPKKNLAMKAFGGLIQATGKSGGGGGAGPDDFEGSIGDLAGMATMVTGAGGDGGGGGGSSGDGLESAVGDLGGAASSFTEGSSGGSSSGSSSSKTSLTGSKDNPEGLGDGKSVLTIRNADGSTTSSGTPPGSDNSNAAAAKTKGSFDYWIYGYTTNPEGELRSLLLATTGGTGPLRYSQKLGIEGFSPEELAKISEQLKPYRVRSTTVSSPYGGKWVKPVAKCRVDHEGLNSDERPINPKFQRVILP